LISSSSQVDVRSQAKLRYAGGPESGKNLASFGLTWQGEQRTGKNQGKNHPWDRSGSNVMGFMALFLTEGKKYKLLPIRPYFT